MYAGNPRVTEALGLKDRWVAVSVLKNNYVGGSVGATAM